MVAREAAVQSADFQISLGLGVFSPLSLTQWRAPSCRCHRSGLAPAERCRCDVRDPLRPPDRLRPQHFGRATSMVWRRAKRAASPRRCNPAPRCGRRAIRRPPRDPPRPRSPRRCAATGRDFWCATVLTWDATPLPAVTHRVRVPPAMLRACGAGLLALCADMGGTLRPSRPCVRTGCACLLRWYAPAAQGCSFSPRTVRAQHGATGLPYCAPHGCRCRTACWARPKTSRRRSPGCTPHRMSLPRHLSRLRGAAGPG